MRFKERALKQLTKKIAVKDKHKILAKLESLGQDPFHSSLDVKKLYLFKNLEKAYRLRVGNLRVIYELDTKTKIIMIYKVDHRRTTTY